MRFFSNARRFVRAAPGFAALFFSLVSSATAAPTVETAGASVGNTSVAIDGVINVIGFDAIKPGATGRFSLNSNEISLTIGNVVRTIPLSSLHSVTIEHSTKAILHGIKSEVAGMLPLGAGNVYGAIRLGVDTMTLFYSDGNQAVHGAVLILPNSHKEELLRAFAKAGVSSVERSTTYRASPTEAAILQREPVIPKTTPGIHSVIVGVPSKYENMPTAYVAAIYEKVIARLNKGDVFRSVWREGDARSQYDALKLQLDITEFSKGNVGLRGAIPMIGMIAGGTRLAAELRLQDSNGNILFHKKVEGSKRMTGESIDSAGSLAARVGNCIKKAGRLNLD